ncbi:MAG TPA: DUF4870 domain-containing protein [Lacisediminihabitans sp.]|jgi:uncharacterized Tic20 family protein|nr:DUF4870 domain-containing protein [Lacisediminihabitans sp.]HXD60860.1 DUF4870 domain-containing protein [Lacisediminihabitans sp.]
MTDPTPQPAAPQPAAPLTAADDKLWASLAHFGGILWILPSLIIFLVLKDRGERTRVESKEALNWQITFLIVWIVWVIIATILAIPFLLIGAGWLLTLIGFLIYAANAVFSIMGGVKVQQGGSYRYPVSFRFIK